MELNDKIVNKLINLRTEIYADGADISEIKELARTYFIKGLTTNPSLMKKAGVNEYLSFAKEAILESMGKPISFEVIGDTEEEIYKQSKIISNWGKNVYVKIPVMNTSSNYLGDVIKKLSEEGVKLNITAIFTKDQIDKVCDDLNNNSNSIISIFAGRIADTGIDPIPIIKYAIEKKSTNRNLQVIWASPRELLNIFQASEVSCDIITVTPDILKKLSNIDKDLHEYSLETVKMFFNDATSSGLKL